MTDQPAQNQTESLEQMGMDRQGVKKGSRVVPLLLLAATVVIFVVYAVELSQPGLQLMTVNSESSLPDKGNNVFVVARVEEQGGRLHFLVFDAKGAKAVAKSEDNISNEEQGESRKKVREKLKDLKEKLASVWGEEPVPLEDKEYILGEIASLTKYDFGLGRYVAALSQGLASGIENDFRVILKAQAKTIGVLVLYALIPGLFGLIYRRAFWMWFAIGFAVLYAIQWGFIASGAGSITPELARDLQLDWTTGAFLNLEVLIILWLLAFRLRRHSAAAIDPATKRNNIILAVGLMIAAFAWFVVSAPLVWWEYACVAILLAVGFATLRQSIAAAADQGTNRKNIVLCLDGTWNQPGTTDFGYLAETNVFKLFKMLKGTTPGERYNASQCRQYLDDNGFVRQIAFYFHGVGNKLENSELGQLFGGAFGMGASAIVERAYLDVARVYRPGDRIFIFGFSRGAAIARLLAGVIGPRGVPMSLWTLRLFGRHRLVWKSSKNIETTAAAGMIRPRGAAPHGRQRPEEKGTHDVPVEVLGCWDTVAAFGVPKKIAGIPFQKINLLKDLSVSLCVKRAYHMVALDEMRDAFVPTLMQPDPITPNRIIEVWFSGDHANIGGGYATDKLSNVTLDFLLRQISSGYAWDAGMQPGDGSWGLYLSAVKKGQGDDDNGKQVSVIDPDPRGRIRQSTGGMYIYAPRILPIHAVIHDDVFKRMQEALPVYAPRSLFNFNQELVEKRAELVREVERLEGTGSLQQTEAEKIRARQDDLSVAKWSQYMKSELSDQSKSGNTLAPAMELPNASV